MEISILNHHTDQSQSTRQRLSLLISAIVHQPPLKQLTTHHQPVNYQLTLNHNSNNGQQQKQRTAHKRKRADSAHWTLTLPTIELGRAFLNFINHASSPDQHGFSPIVKFIQSIDNHTSHPTIKRPSKKLIHQLRTTPFNLLSENDTHQDNHNENHNPLPSDSPALLASIDYGRLTTNHQHAQFRSEYHLCFHAPRDPASILIHRSSPQIIIRRIFEEREDHLTLIDSKIVNRIEADHNSLLLFLDHPPTFLSTPHDKAAESIRSNQGVSYHEARKVCCIPSHLNNVLLADPPPHGPPLKHLSNASGEQLIKFRQSGFDDDHRRIASFASHLIKLSFIDSSESAKFLDQCHQLVIPKVVPLKRSSALTSAYTRANLERVNCMTPKFDLIVSFQLDALLYSHLLNPIEIVQLRPWIIDMPPLLAERVLIRLASDLRCANDPLVQQAVHHKAHNLQLSPAGLAAKFEHARARVNQESVKRFEQMAQRENVFNCRSVIITPTSLVLEGPFPEEGNSILRLYDYNSAFIRVALREEDGSLHRWDRGVDVPGFMRDYYRPLAKELFIAGQPFEFLCYSSSALKCHQAWFVCPFIHRGELMTARKIRDRMGSFPQVINIPARYMARVAQAVTATKRAITLQPSKIKMMDDVERNGSIFTDGVGTISPSLARKVEEALSGSLGSKASCKFHSSCYQIRLGGHKGMLSLDNTLEGDIVKLRPSMKKFDGESFTLDIANSFGRPYAAFLNRSLIKILEDLRIPARIFLEAQERAVVAVEKARLSMRQSSELMELVGLGSASELPRVLRELSVLMDNDETGGIYSAFIQDCLDLFAVYCLRELKYNARIPLTDCYNLVGVADEDACLHENQIFACIQPKGSPKRYLSGLVAIARSPCLHPGDVQVVTAVGKPPAGSRRLEGLVNCVVFSLFGKRSLPSCLAGGDLDGDLYTIITDPQMVPNPRHIYQPGNYDSGEMKIMDGLCTIQDGIDFFFDYISKDNIGIIANKHLLIADQSPHGVLDPRCLTLASLHSKAVDYSKTGMAVEISELPKCAFKRPDFMCPENMLDDEHAQSAEQSKKPTMYRSPKVLGQLFRAIPPDQIKRYQKRLVLDGQTNCSGEGSGRFGRAGLDGDGAITKQLLRRLSAHDVTVESCEPWMEEMASLRGEFVLDLSKICHADRLLLKPFSHSTKNLEDHQAQDRTETWSPYLSEAEVLMGWILKDAGRGGKRTKKEAVRRLQSHASHLFMSLRSAICPEDLPPLPALQRAFAGWALSASDPAFGSHSFAVVCLDLLLTQFT